MKKNDNFTKLRVAFRFVINRRAFQCEASKSTLRHVRFIDRVADHIRVQPTYAPFFVDIDDFLNLAKKYHFNYYVTVDKNEIGLDAPVLTFYPAE